MSRQETLRDPTSVFKSLAEREKDIRAGYEVEKAKRARRRHLKLVFEHYKDELAYDGHEETSSDDNSN